MDFLITKIRLSTARINNLNSGKKFKPSKIKEKSNRINHSYIHESIKYTEYEYKAEKLKI